ncbi:histidine phosphatase superfamily [Nemania serpens]|nr:histidine phosphatase superfamily [Nemania serpens]
MKNTQMRGPIIDIVRHGEGQNNVSGHAIPDPDLTRKGKKQCRKLRDTYPHISRVKLIVSSPLRRALHTAYIAFFSGADLPHPLHPHVVLLPELQENSARPGDTGSPLSALVDEFGFRIDASELMSGGGETWYHKGPGTAYFPSLPKVEERARVARVWLRGRARELGDGDRLVVVTHGAFAHFLVQNFAGLLVGRGSGVWLNAGFRSFQFIDLEGDDPDAALVELRDSRGRPATPWCELTDEARALQKSYAVDRLRRHEQEALTAVARRD